MNMPTQEEINAARLNLMKGAQQFNMRVKCGISAARRIMCEIMRAHGWAIVEYNHPIQ